MMKIPTGQIRLRYDIFHEIIIMPDGSIADCNCYAADVPALLCKMGCEWVQERS